MVSFLFCQTAFEQIIDKSIVESWQTLKIQILRLSDNSIKTIEILELQKATDTVLVKNFKSNIFQLNKLLDSSNNLSNILVNNIRNRNDSLTKYFRLSSEIIDKDSTHSGEFHELQMKIEGTENRVYVAIKEFNKVYNTKGRQDLLYIQKQ